MTGRTSVFACMFAVFGAVSSAQIGGMAVSGEVAGVDPETLSYLTVELAPEGHSDIPARAAVERDGSFRVHNVEPGYYELTVLNRRGDVVRRDQVNISMYSGPIAVRLDDGAGTLTTAGGGPVSIASLRHKPSKRAIKLCRESAKELHRGNMAASIKKLEAALAIDPEFVEAYNDLGTRYITAKEYAKALEYLQKAENLDPASAMVLSNEAISLYALDRAAQAEQTARRALQLDPASVNATYVLGLSLAKQGKNRLEAITDLRRVQDRYPLARKISEYLENQPTSTPSNSRRF